MKTDITIPVSLNPKPSDKEISVAYLFSQHYRSAVEFLEPHKGYKQKTPDFKSGGIVWEIKSPVGVSLNSIEKHIIKALKQSPNIIIDSRESKLSDYRIAQELYRLAKQRRKIHKLLLLNKHNKIQEIYIKGKGLTKPTRV